MKDDNQAISVNSADLKSTYLGNVILHLSDLHFDSTSSSKQKMKRDTLLGDLIDCIKGVEPAWKPTIVCITGDIAWSAKDTEYQLAQKWINKLLSELEIDRQNIVLCPGNHDVIVDKAKKIPQPKNTIEANESLTIPIPSQYQNLFSNYIDFCTSLNCEYVVCGDYRSHLFGIREINGIYFLVCNSCWFFKNMKKKRPRFFKLRRLLRLVENEESFDEKMWLGTDLFGWLDSSVRLSTLKQSNRIIALVHHPERYLHEDETMRFPGNDNPTVPWINERTDVVLTGHSHSLPLKPTGHTINCGAGFKGTRDRNVFCLIRVEAERCRCQFYTSDPSRPGNKWEKEGGVHPILFSTSVKMINALIDHGNSLDTLSSIHAQLRDQIAKAQDYIGRLEYNRAFSIADDVVNVLNEKEALLAPEFLTEACLALADIEITRVKWRYLTAAVPEDFTRVKELFKKAKEYNERGGSKGYQTQKP